MSAPYAQAHADPQGPGDARPTAAQIVADSGVEGKWSDRVILITGCSSGIGVETSKALYKTGATLWLSARDLEKARKALGDEVASSSRVHLLEMSLDSLESVRKAAQRFNAESDCLDVLITNAGIMACPYSHTVDGLEAQIGTNHFGHFLLFELVKERLLASPSPRLVALSSLAHRFGKPNLDDINWEKRGEEGYQPWESYGASKTAAVWLANEAQRRYATKGLVALSVHPGGIFTGLQKHVSDEQMKGWREEERFKKTFKSIEQGAATTVWAATSPYFDGPNKGGVYCEDCSVSKAVDPQAGQWGNGYAEWAYDPKSETAFWELSQKIVGTA